MKRSVITVNYISENVSYIYCCMCDGRLWGYWNTGPSVKNKCRRLFSQQRSHVLRTIDVNETGALVSWLTLYKMPICLLQNQRFGSDSLALLVTIALKTPMGVWKYDLRFNTFLLTENNLLRNVKSLASLKIKAKFPLRSSEREFHLQISEQMRR